MSQPKPKLIVMSGLPGCGKSTLARLIAREVPATVLSVDPIESAMCTAGLVRSFETGYAAYLVAEALASEQLALGLTVLVDAVNAEEEGKNLWRRLAGRHGATLVVIEVTLANRDLHRARVEARVRGLPGFSELSWEEVEARRKAYTQWREPALGIDASGSAEQNASKAVAYIRAC
jgi:predicted kinase